MGRTARNGCVLVSVHSDTAHGGRLSLGRVAPRCR